MFPFEILMYHNNGDFGIACGSSFVMGRECNSITMPKILKIVFDKSLNNYIHKHFIR